MPASTVEVSYRQPRLNIRMVYDRRMVSDSQDMLGKKILQKTLG